MLAHPRVLGVFGIAVFFLLLTFVHTHWSQHQRHAARRRRQSSFGSQLSPEQTVELNFSVPFIFSARLYPYGQDKGDQVMNTGVYSQPFVLQHRMTYLGREHTVLHITRDGAVGFSANLNSPSNEPFPRGPRVIAPYWAASDPNAGKVYYRETTDTNIISLAASEIEIQYRYPQTFRPQSVVIVTWENLSPVGDSGPKNLFQMALIISDNGTFAHFVYSKLQWHNNALAGYNEGNGFYHMSLPGSASSNVVRLANDSDIGIPGEWMFKIDTDAVFLCGPGFKGLECITQCSETEFYYDCSRICHCDGGSPCDSISGECPGGQCKKGWVNPPTCDLDYDECEGQVCSASTPDCINTPGSFICTCLHGFNNATQSCRGVKLPEAIEVIPSQPRVVFKASAPVDGVQIIARPASQIPEKKRPTRPLARRPTAPVGESSPVPPTQPAATVATSTQFQGPFPTRSQAVPQPTFAVPPQTSSRPSFPFPFPTQQSPHGQPLLCADLQCSQQAHCELQTGGRPTCICNDGWSGDGFFCADMNECLLQTACSGPAQCQNTPGSFQCICETGYRMEEGQCVDIDECAEGHVKCPGGNTAQCVNTFGGHECRCRTGYNGNPSSILGCIDINECLIPEFYCGPNALCENNLGGYICECKAGYTQNTEGTACVDLDECAHNPCSDAALCTNTQGSFVCSCLEGYAGDGIQCDSETLFYPFDETTDNRLPPVANAHMEIPILSPIIYLGKSYDRIYVSSNGIITFDQSVQHYSNSPIERLGVNGVAPLFAPISLSEGGNVYVRQTDDDSFRARSDIEIHDEFNDPTFQSAAVYIVTYENVAHPGTERRSNYQVVITSSPKATYATLIYDKVGMPLAQAGILSNKPELSVLLPGSAQDVGQLAQSSNIGLQGKWMFRLDLPQIISCPAGYTGPPFCLNECIAGTWGLNCAERCPFCIGGATVCDRFTGECPEVDCLPGYSGQYCNEDIDECETGLARCSPEAECVNYAGSYGCNCRSGYTGDGVTCVEYNPCDQLQCHPLAQCILTGNGSIAECRCLQAYTGDGYTTCEIRPETSQPTTPVPTPTARSTPAPKVPVRPTVSTLTTPAQLVPDLGTGVGLAEGVDLNEVFPEHPPIHPALLTTPRTTPLLITSPTTPIHPHLANDVRRAQADISNDITSDTQEQAYAFDTEPVSSTSSLLVIVVPAVLCGVWLLLIVILLIICIRRRKRRQREKFNMGYYSQAASVGPTTYYAGSASHWSMPRMAYPGPYAASSYAPSTDPYGAYKF